MPFSRTAFFGVFVAALVPQAASAGNTAQQSNALPGVDGDYRIVRPAPELEETAPGTHFNIGDMEVRVSGSITVDIGVGALRPPRH